MRWRRMSSPDIGQPVGSVPSPYRRRKYTKCVLCGEPGGKYCAECVITCSFPGCDRPPQQRGRRCWGHGTRRGIVGGIHCQICGFGPRSSLHNHVRIFHDGASAYKRQFGKDSLESLNVRLGRMELWMERVEDGVQMTGRRKGYCAQGHRMIGKNLITYECKDGATKRACRKCVTQWERQRRARDRPPFKRNYRKCHWCGERYWPTKRNQRYCCQACMECFLDAKYKAERRKRRGRCKCEQCGVIFDANRPKQRFCSDACGQRARQLAKKAERPPIPTKACQICGADFTPRRAGREQVVCGTECRAEAARHRARRQRQ
jgi:hypothetical protein